MNNTDVYWEIDGTSLHTYAWSVQTLTGREGLPPRLGDNQRVAYRHGEIWRRKLWGPRPLSLAMWVIGRDEDGEPGPEGPWEQWRSNLEVLKALFAPLDRLLVVTKRIKSNDGLLVLTGEAEVSGAIEPNMQAPAAAAFVVDMLMPDPFWYGAEVTDTLEVGPNTLANPGNTAVERMVLRFNGPLTDAQLVNTSLTPPVALSVMGEIADGDWIELDTATFRAVDQDGVSVLGRISHSGAWPWMVLQPGSNAMQLNVGAGTGTVDVAFSSAYL